MLKRFLQKLRRKKIGLVMGVFDFAHAGHRTLLERAKQECDELIVAIHTDAWCRSFKEVIPANSELERLRAVKALDIANRVLLSSDRNDLCRRFAITHVFHGDDWSLDTMREIWAPWIDRYDLQLATLPYTSEVSSSTLRERTPPIGWWLHPLPNSFQQKAGLARDHKPRIHIFNHLNSLYRELGGVWIVHEDDREFLLENAPHAPCVITTAKDRSSIAKQIARYDFQLLITARTQYFRFAQYLAQHGSKAKLIALSHGRSGKKPTQSLHGSNRKSLLSDREKPLLEQHYRLDTELGAITVFDWRFALDSYTHLDHFLKKGGKFQNLAPKIQPPRILLLTTWSDNAKQEGLLLAPRWRKAVADLTQHCDVWLSPHPLCKPKLLENFATQTGVKLLEATGASFALVPDVHCVITDLTGALFEALLFDTPVILAQSDPPQTWPDDYPPTQRDLETVVPLATPETLVELTLQQIGKRNATQHALATQRLGVVDGRATKRVAAALQELLARTEQERRNAALHHDAAPPFPNTEM